MHSCNSDVSLTIDIAVDGVLSVEATSFEKILCIFVATL